MRFHADPSSDHARLVLDEGAEVATRLAFTDDADGPARGIELHFDEQRRLVAIAFEGAAGKVPSSLLDSGEDLLVEHDPDADAAYLYLQPVDRAVAETLTFAEDENRPAWGINLDFDGTGCLIGVEFETADLVPPSLLAHAHRI